jgi:hypothetical protein
MRWTLALSRFAFCSQAESTPAHCPLVQSVGQHSTYKVAFFHVLKVQISTSIPRMKNG